MHGASADVVGSQGIPLHRDLGCPGDTKARYAGMVGQVGLYRSPRPTASRICTNFEGSIFWL